MSAFQGILRSVKLKTAGVGAAAAMVLLGCVSAPPQDERHLQGTTASGSNWIATIPANWNGVLLVWSHGYQPTSRPPQLSPDAVTDQLLDDGYALLGSSYSGVGWAVEQAAPDQLAAIAAFRKQAGNPDAVIAWGASMGGLVTTELAEQHPGEIDGGLALCSSIGGSLGMMNMALDGAFAFKVLVAPDAGLELVNVTDDRENLSRVVATLEEARKTPAGRARVALAAVLAGLPDWSDPAVARPDGTDAWEIEAQMAKAFPMGVFLPRSDQEARAGGVFSWNDGVDYAALIEGSGRKDFLSRLYVSAALDLEADIRKLQTAPRVEAEPEAVRYMRDHYSPIGQPARPLLAVQRTGDGMTSPSMQQAYETAATAHGAADNFRSLWVEGAGHCNFSETELRASVEVIRQRVTDGRWPVSGNTSPLGEARPYPMTRTCFNDGSCRILIE